MAYEEYISLLGNKTILEALHDRIGMIFSVLKRVDEEQKWDYKYAENKWTVKQVVQHLIDCERIFSFRAMHIARKDEAPLFLFDEDKYAEQADLSLKKWDDLLQEYRSLLESSYWMYKGFDNEILHRSKWIGENEMNVETIGKFMAGHSLHHMQILEERYLERE